MTDYGAEIRKLADAYREKTGKDSFSGVSGGTFAFDTGTLSSGTEALGYMRERLMCASSGVPEPCISVPGEPCMHMPEHTRHRGEGYPVDHSNCVPATWGHRTHNHEGIPGAWLFPGEVTPAR